MRYEPQIFRLRNGKMTRTEFPKMMGGVLTMNALLMRLGFLTKIICECTKKAFPMVFHLLEMIIR